MLILMAAALTVANAATALAAPMLMVLKAVSAPVLRPPKPTLPTDKLADFSVANERLDFSISF
ncbi:hypothetical protein OHAE_931 [Ochrobactrum soli]|uniref:Uncharacterized protein n=1 Tax=Ochrobactrum soli TaxID=2448455 RepID=A0A2P9HLS4_9HYPH|nr:hypothetical protein OHAE_931 [[Ochrobactrum] soli]